MTKSETIRREWAAEIDPDRDGGDIEITAAGAVIAQVLGSDSFPCLDPDDSDFNAIDREQEAVARLIAAAPCLLSALIVCRDRLVSLGEALGELTDPGDVAALNAADAAIQKAVEGRTNG